MRVHYDYFISLETFLATAPVNTLKIPHINPIAPIDAPAGSPTPETAVPTPDALEIKESVPVDTETLERKS